MTTTVFLSRYACLTIGLLAALPGAAARAESCPPAWTRGFGLPDRFSSVRAMTAFDDGTGPALYLGGYSADPESTLAGGIAKSVPGAPGQWSALSSGMNSSVIALVVFDDGTGPALYAGGWFTTAGGVTANHIAKWNPGEGRWSALGSGMAGAAIPEYTRVDALAVYDDGHGPALYAGGMFTTAGGVPADGIAKWHPGAPGYWSAVGGGLAGTSAAVHALCVFDDGTGPALVAGGWFPTAGGAPANHIAKWDGARWSALGSGMNELVLALTPFDDGTGPALVAGGQFTTAGGVTANCVAKWTPGAPGQWLAMGNGMNGMVSALTVFDDGTGPAVIAGGYFDTAAGVPVNHIAKWNPGTPGQWSALGTGTNCPVEAFTVFDDVAGPALVAGGCFTTAGGVNSVGVARWGCQTSPTDPDGDGIPNESDNCPDQYNPSQADCDTNGTGDACEPGATDCNADGVPDNCDVAAGTSTDCQSNGVPDECDLTGGTSADCNANAIPDECDLAAGTAPDCNTNAIPDSCDLAAGTSADLNTNGIPDECDPETCPPAWTPGFGESGMDGGVHALTVFDDGTGPALYAGGRFTTAGGVPANYVAKWNGMEWSALDTGTDSYVYALTVFDDGNGTALVVGGNFTIAGGVLADGVAKWNPGTPAYWSALGNGMSDYGVVCALTGFDDGTGPALHAGGAFAMGPAPGLLITKWDGAQWLALAGVTTGEVRALAVFDGGATSALCVGGWFAEIGGVPANHIAQWAGTEWSPLGSGMSARVRALAIFDAGHGPALVAGGDFTTAGDVPANHIATWNGASWLPLDGGMNGTVTALTVFDDGTGPALYAGGLFTSAGGVPVSNIAKWDGTNWSALGSGVDGQVSALAVFDEGAGPSLHVGGWFTVAGGMDSVRIARWGCQISAADHDGDGIPNSSDNCPEQYNLDQADCDTNGTGDACEPGATDCNTNGIPDNCDITSGTSLDCNLNARPDECDMIEAGDFDADGDVDLVDYRSFTDCLAGPDATPVPPTPACAAACLAAFDADADGDVDLADFGVFQRQWAGPPGRALLVRARPARDGTLWRTAHNVIRLTFDRSVTAPAPGQILIQALEEGGAFGADLSAGFTFALENDAQGRPRILRISEDGSQLAHRTWIAVRNVGAWSTAADFAVPYVVMMGDVDHNGYVQNADAGAVYAHVSPLPVADDCPWDVDGDGYVKNLDVSAIQPFIAPIPRPPKPSGHGPESRTVEASKSRNAEAGRIVRSLPSRRAHAARVAHPAPPDRALLEEGRLLNQRGQPRQVPEHEKQTGTEDESHHTAPFAADRLVAGAEDQRRERGDERPNHNHDCGDSSEHDASPPGPIGRKPQNRPPRS